MESYNLRPRFNSSDALCRQVLHAHPMDRYSDKRDYRMRTTHYTHSLSVGTEIFTADKLFVYYYIVRKFGSSWKVNTGIVPELRLPKFELSKRCKTY